MSDKEVKWKFSTTYDTVNSSVTYSRIEEWSKAMKEKYNDKILCNNCGNVISKEVQEEFEGYCCIDCKYAEYIL
jgi:hypothetical protein